MPARGCAAPASLRPRRVAPSRRQARAKVRALTPMGVAVTFRARSRKPAQCTAHVRSSRPHASRALVPGPDPRPAALLGGPWLRDPAALRHGGRRRHVSPGDHAARARTEAVERRLCAAVAAAQGRALRREPDPPAALLSVPGDPQTLAARHPGPLSRLA